MPPSKAVDLLKSCLNKRVEKLVRFSWWPADEVLAQCGADVDLAFASTAGPLAIYFEGNIVLGLASDPALNSIVVWDERVQNILEPDGELFQISASDKKYSIAYWDDIAGHCLLNIDVLRKTSMNEKESLLPSEVGLRMSFDNGGVLIASHGLHDGSDDFSILQESQALLYDVGYFPLK